MERKKLFATKRLREIREAKELKQTEMADILSLTLKRNVSQSLYQKWEQGSTSVSLMDAVAISRQFEVNLKELWRAR